MIFSLGGQDCDGDSVSEEPYPANDAEENSLTPEAKFIRLLSSSLMLRWNKLERLSPAGFSGQSPILNFFTAVI